MAMKYLAGVPDEEINKMTHLNAMRHFQYDPFAHIPREQTTVAALRKRATGWDVSIRPTAHLRPLAAQASV
jgi:hypothetical protein